MQEVYKYNYNCEFDLYQVQSTNFRCRTYLPLRPFLCGQISARLMALASSQHPKRKRFTKVSQLSFQHKPPTGSLGSTVYACAKTADRIAHVSCLVLAGVLFSALLLVVVMRYVFGIGFLQLQDLANYAFATIVVIGIPIAYRRDAHVRVDILRDSMSPRLARAIDIAAYFLLVVPVFGIALWYVWPEITYAWSIREGALETGGLPGYFLVKTMFPLACVLMIVQGLVITITTMSGDNHGN